MRWFLLLCTLLALTSCQNGNQNNQVAQLQKEMDSLKAQNVRLQNQQVKERITQTAKENEQRQKEALEQLQNSILKSNTSWKYYTSWKYLGTVELYTLKQEYKIVHVLNFQRSYTLERTGEGIVYVRNGDEGREYELRYSSGGKSYAYHVAFGNFSVTDDYGVSMQFSAHAGSHYFDL